MNDPDVFYCRWGELESGQTTIAFTPVHQHETDDLTGHVKNPRSAHERGPVEVCFAYPDVDAAFKVISFHLFVFFLLVFGMCAGKDNLKNPFLFYSPLHLLLVDVFGIAIKLFRIILLFYS